MDVTSDIIRRV